MLENINLPQMMFLKILSWSSGRLDFTKAGQWIKSKLSMFRPNVKTWPEQKMQYLIFVHNNSILFQQSMTR